MYVNFIFVIPNSSYFIIELMNNDVIPQFCFFLFCVICVEAIEEFTCKEKNRDMKF